jgi:very-short-patch-repair endonuclease
VKRNFQTLDELLKAIKDPKSLFQYLKWNCYLQRELVLKTSHLNQTYLVQPMSQRLYHYINDIDVVPTNHTGWFYKYVNINEGYSSTKLQDVRNQEWHKLNDTELFAYFKTFNSGVRDPFLKKWLNDKTTFLDSYNPSIFDRACHIRHDLNYPLFNFNTNKLAGRAARNAVNEIKATVNEFCSMDELQKRKWCKTWALLPQYKKTIFTKHVWLCYPITDYLIKYTRKVKGLQNCRNLSQIAYHIAYDIRDVPTCKQCNKQIHWLKFNKGIGAYPTTCSHKCNNTYATNIEKRLANNSTNKNGYQTNIGKNEAYILNKLRRARNLSLEYNKKVGPFFVDGVDEKAKIAIEVQEKHHSYTNQFIKDKKKVKFLLDKGYKIILALDNWFLSKTKQPKFQRKYKDFFQNTEGVEVIECNCDNGHVFTSSGWSSFLGTKKTMVTKEGVKLETTKGKCITVTKDHLIFFNEHDFKAAEEFVVGDDVWTDEGTDTVYKICKSNCDITEWYDVIETEDNTFFANGIKVHNCLAIDEAAFIESHLLDEFWASVIPSISSGKTSKILMVSTPNGIGNKFYEIYSGAEKKTIKGWVAERMNWHDVPGRDEAWKEDMIAALGGSEEKFLQEFGNVFIDDASSAVGASVIEKFKREKLPPLWTSDDGEYIVFEYPNPEKLYVIGVDVGEGIGRAASVAQVLDVTNLQEIRQVGVYGSTTIEPFHFANKLNTIGHSWGCAPMLIERNNCGAQVIDALYYKHQYEKITSYNKISESDKYNRTRNLGVLSHTNIKFDGIQNMRYWINHLEVVKINDPTTISEFETFVRQPNGIYKKRNDNFFDDRIMALVWALFILEPEICEQYFTIAQFDTQHKPMKITTNGYWEKINEDYQLRDLSMQHNVIVNPDPNYDSTTAQTSENIFRNMDFDHKYDLDMETLLGQGYTLFTPPNVN